MSCRNFIPACLLLLLAGRVAADPVDQLVQRRMAEQQIPGLALRIIAAGREVKSAHYGLAQLEPPVPVSAGTIFEIGSLTKQFTAAAVLLLQQEGRLTLDDPIRRHLPHAPPAWGAITIRHLLTHTSGLRNYTGLDGFELSRALSQRQFIDALAQHPLEFAPGDQARYCNSGYNLLGYLIENSGGQAYWHFMAQRLFTPLGLRSAGERAARPATARHAQGYLWKEGAHRLRDPDLTDIFAAGAIAATADDLVKWNAALDTGQLLNAASKRALWTPMKLNDGTLTEYGLGWRVGTLENEPLIGHSGSTSGFSASLQRLPGRGLTVIVLCNADGRNLATALALEIARLQLGSARKP